MTDVQEKPISPIQKWMIAIRPFAFPASVVPVLFGTTLAVTIGQSTFHPLRLILSLLAIMTLHAGSNLLNDINDFKSGLDKTPIPVSGAIVRGLITTGEALHAAILLLALGSLLGLWLVWIIGPVILLLGVAGVTIGIAYTTKPFALKYHALGDPAVFLNFGILGSLGAWTVQTGHLSWIPTLWAIPIGMLVVAILHANNWRDIESDREGKITTLAGLLGDQGSLLYYSALLFGAFLFVLAFTIATNLFGATVSMPWTCLVIFTALPMAIKLWKRARQRRTSPNPMDFITLDGATAQLNMAFGLLYTAGLILHPLFIR